MKNKKNFLFPTIKMADLFDFKVGGLGFHITAHMIAIAALFVACFAITGYISFRDDTVPGSALKDQDADLEDVTLTSINHNGGITEKVYTVVIDGALAARSAGDDSIALFASGFTTGMHVVESGMEVLTATNADLGALTIEIGTAANCAVDNTGGTAIANAATLAATNVVGSDYTAYATGHTADFSFSATNDAICLAAANNTALTSGKIVAYIKVVAMPGLTLP